MTDTPQAAAGWYPDPYRPDELRYYDGQDWTEHYRKEGALPDIGDWLNATFSVIKDHFLGAAIIAVGFSLIGGLLTWVMVRLALGDLAVIDEELVGFDLGRTVTVGVIGIVATILWQAFTGLALMCFMQRAHQQAGPTVGAAMARALRRLPKSLAVFLIIVFVFMLMAVVLGAVIALAIEVNAAFAGLAVLLGLLLAVLTVYLWVRFAFLNAAIAAAPKGESVARASLGISRGRFWGVFGRLLLLAVAVSVGANILGAASGGNASVINPTSIQQDLIDASGPGEPFEFPDIVFGDLVPTGGGFIVFMLFSGFVSGLAAMVSASATMRLYLEAGGPTD